MYNKENKNNEKGFTMIELIIVVAIMGIIGAVLVPTFSNMTTKARLTSDITTIKTLQRQIDVYVAEFGEYPSSDGTTASGMTTSVIVPKLITAKYMDNKYTSGSDLRLQTKGSQAEYSASKNHFVLKVTSPSALKVDDANKAWVE